MLHDFSIAKPYLVSVTPSLYTNADVIISPTVLIVCPIAVFSPPTRLAKRFMPLPNVADGSLKKSVAIPTPSVETQSHADVAAPLSADHAEDRPDLTFPFTVS